MATDQIHNNYGRRLIKCLNISLLLFIVLFQLFPKQYFRQSTIIPLPTIKVDFVVEIPATTQTVRFGRPRPKRPVIPIQSADDDIPEDLTIDDTDVEWDLGDALFGNAGLTTSGPDTIQPRPYYQALPDYPKELRKQKVKGNVKLYLWVDSSGVVKQVIVAENNTGSKECEKAAIQAAQKNRYIPAQVGDEKIPTWVTCLYSFTPE